MRKPGQQAVSGIGIPAIKGYNAGCFQFSSYWWHFIGTRMGCKLEAKFMEYRCAQQSLLQGNLLPVDMSDWRYKRHTIVWQTFPAQGLQNEGATSNTTVRPSTTFQANGPTLRDNQTRALLWVALIDLWPALWDTRTNPRTCQAVWWKRSEVIAYGKMEYGQTVTDYVPFEFELEYKSTSRIPKYILITASASKYGDYFTGGTGSILYLDDLQLLYDY